MKNRIILLSLLFLIITGCVGTSSSGIFGTGVSVALDPRTLGTQIDDSVMQKNLATRMILREKKYLLSVNTKVLDGKIFLTGSVENPEEKLQLTKLAWETKGVRSVKNDIKIKEDFNFKQSAKDLLITSQLRTDRAPFVSQASFVNCNFSSGVSTFPVRKILPSSTLELTDRRYFLSLDIILVAKFFCIIESSIWVPNVLGSKAIDTPVPKIPFEETPTQPNKIMLTKKISIILIFIF